MKGYIARERGMVVLSKNNTAFPGRVSKSDVLIVNGSLFPKLANRD